MRRNILYYLLLGVILTWSIYGCNKDDESYNPQGGYLPTNYITIQDSSFSPLTITLVAGNSITFLNSTNSNHQIISDDSVTINTNVLGPQGHYYWKKDTVGTFPIHCVNHPRARGLITLTP